MIRHGHIAARWRAAALAAAAGLLLAAAGGAVDDQADREGGPRVPARLRDARAAAPSDIPRVHGYERPARRRWFQGALRRPAAQGLPDFERFSDVQQKKLEFFAWVLPMVHQENDRLRDVRRRLTAVCDQVRWGRPVSDEDRRWLQDLAREFRIQEADPAAAGFWEAAFERVDALPVDLVVVQAANESAWGTSRFAREGNNLFGQWCFSPGCGIVPLERPEGEAYEVARFASPAESVGSYMRNLNTGRSYRLLRRIRADQRAQGRRPDAGDLTAGLIDYSERGPDYVADIRAMLRVNAPVIAAARDRLEDPRDKEG